VEGDLANLPDLPQYQLVQAADDCLELTVEKGQSLNDVFVILNSAGLQVRSMRTKANRLEELFVGLIQKHQQQSKQQSRVEPSV
jgi:ABC-2 type transport system ATP-binding protein